jgi:hypothetical protein
MKQRREEAICPAFSMRHLLKGEKIIYPEKKAAETSRSLGRADFLQKNKIPSCFLRQAVI